MGDRDQVSLVRESDLTALEAERDKLEVYRNSVIAGAVDALPPDCYLVKREHWDHLKNAESEAYDKGWGDGVTLYAVWRDGRQRVGVTQKPLLDVLVEGPPVDLKAVALAAMGGDADKSPTESGKEVGEGIAQEFLDEMETLIKTNKAGCGKWFSTPGHSLDAVCGKGGSLCAKCIAVVEKDKCPSCKGSGHADYAAVRCEVCGGTGRATREGKADE